MRLELGKINISDVQFGAATEVRDGVLYVNREEVQALILEDERIVKADIELARPGEEVRIIPVKDVIEPRVKVSGSGQVFPGMVSKVDTVGEGRTHVLSGAAVVTTGRIVGFQEGIIDMSGPGAEYTPFSKLNLVVLVCEPVEGLPQHEHEAAIRKAGLRVAAYLGEAARNEPDSVQRDAASPEAGSLPRASCHKRLMLQSQGSSTIPRVRRRRWRTLPTPSAPLEAWTGHRVGQLRVGVRQEHHLPSPEFIIHELFKRHGKDINFMAVITNENVTLDRRARPTTPRSHQDAGSRRRSPEEGRNLTPIDHELHRWSARESARCW